MRPGFPDDYVKRMVTALAGAVTESLPRAVSSTLTASPIKTFLHVRVP